jgi:DNA-binding transcriptional regulator LsrR (DeoR family)
VVAEWWRGRTHAREQILAATEVISSVAIAKAAGVALAGIGDICRDARQVLERRFAKRPFLFPAHAGCA